MTLTLSLDRIGPDDRPAAGVGPSRWRARHNVTFIVPLAAGTVERRGGMLIHGAGIARDDGLPCIPNLPGAAELIITGNRVTVDGYLAIVTLHGRDPEPGRT
jgi:hypothetical protein